MTYVSFSAADMKDQLVRAPIKCDPVVCSRDDWANKVNTTVISGHRCTLMKKSKKGRKKWKKEGKNVDRSFLQ